MTPSNPGSDPLRGQSSGMERAELAFAFALVGLLGLLILPVSARLLDVLIILNFGLALVMMLLSVSIRRSIDFSAFPTLLLFVTMFRLALHVSSTRLILTHGEAFDGVMIKAFGTWVAGENPVVGVVIFGILVLVQYLIITKGSERVAEVAARFHLDAMPVRLMALDSAQNAGMPMEEVAERRLEIQLEADFYGSMDGASRYVRGENIAAVIIVLINIAGGVGMGLYRGNTQVAELFQATILLTIGDGLVNLVPSLVVSLTMGIVITKTARASSLSVDVMQQVVQEPRVLVMSAGFLSALLGTFAIGSGTFSPAAAMGAVCLAWAAWRLSQLPSGDEATSPAVEVTSASSMDLTSQLLDPTLRLVVGPGVELLLADQERLPPALRARATIPTISQLVNRVRTEAAQELGLFVPELQIALKPAFAPGAYALHLRGDQVGASEIAIGHVLDLGPGAPEGPGLAMRGFDPRAAHLRDATPLWILAERADPGRNLLLPGEYLALHLRELVRAHADEILGLEELKVILGSLHQHSPAVAEEIGQGRVPPAALHTILKLLLAEGISIRNLPVIVQTMAANLSRLETGAEALLEPVRAALSTQICRELADETGYITCMLLDPAVEAQLLMDMQASGGKLALEAGRARTLLDDLTQFSKKLRERPARPVFAVDPRLRLHLRRLFAKFLPDLAVISHNEIGRNHRLRSIGRVGGRKRKSAS